MLYLLLQKKKCKLRRAQPQGCAFLLAVRLLVRLTDMRLGTQEPAVGVPNCVDARWSRSQLCARGHFLWWIQSVPHELFAVRKQLVPRNLAGVKIGED